MTTPGSSISVLTPGQVVGGCRIINRIGNGGMGVVYLAEHLQLGTLNAIKTIRADACTPVEATRLLKEARAAARIKHPNVVTIHDAGSENELHFIRMEYVEGKNLAELVEERNGPLSWQDTLRLMRFAAKGLDAVHQQRLLHRDVKPSNIMLSSKPARVVLMDFGLARDEAPSGITLTGMVAGTPGYMSPEQWRGGRPSRQSDIYSLGAAMYTLLTGRPPFLHSESDQLLSGKRPVPAHELNPYVPKPISDVAMKMLSPRPGERYLDASIVVRELGSLLQSALKDDIATSHLPASRTAHATVLTIPELLPTDLIPDESTWNDWKPRLAWIAGGVFLLAVAMILIASVVSLINRWDSKESDNGSPPVALVAGTTRDGMVLIPQGLAYLGCEQEKLRKYFSQFDEFSSNPELLEANLNNVANDLPRRVAVPAFWIDQYEVTNSQYARFLASSGRQPPALWHGATPPAEKGDCPVEGITYDDAAAYASWAGKELPTEAQWIRAFHGENDWLFPWGDQYASDRANVYDNRDIPVAQPTAVSSTPNDVSGFKVFNLVGNVSEFVRNEADLRTSRSKGGRYDSDGHIVGNYMYYSVAPAEITGPGLGFRCVAEEP